jgi:hypothetical protein
MDTADERPAPDRVSDALGAREALTALIVDQITTNGYFLAHVDAQPHQHLVDLRWAAQLAGRALGRRTRTQITEISALRAGKVAVLIAPDDRAG